MKLKSAEEGCEMQLKYTEKQKNVSWEVNNLLNNMTQETTTLYLSTSFVVFYFIIYQAAIQ